MAIENEALGKWVREDVRPFAEHLRDLKAALRSRLTKWYAGHNSTAVNDAKESIAEYRDDKGVVAANGAQLNSLMAILASLDGVLNAPGVDEIIEAFCVRSKDLR